MAKKVCKNEQGALIDIKVLLLNYLKGLDSKNKKHQKQLFKIYDVLPSLSKSNLVEHKCKVCKFPSCEDGKDLLTMLRTITPKEKPKQLTANLMKIGYIKKRLND